MSSFRNLTFQNLMHTIPTGPSHSAGLGLSVSSYHSGREGHRYPSWTGNLYLSLMSPRRSSGWEKLLALLRRFQWFSNCKHSPFIWSPQILRLSFLDLKGYKATESSHSYSRAPEPGQLLRSLSDHLWKSPKLCYSRSCVNTEGAQDCFYGSQ